MQSFNQVILMGNLTRDPELRYTPKGSAVCEFGLAVNRQWKGEDGAKKEDVSFFDVVAWGRTGEVAAEYLRKGRPVFIAGRLQQERWDDKTTGQKRSKVKIVAERIQFLGAKGEQAPPSGAEETPAAGAEAPGDDIPF